MRVPASPYSVLGLEPGADRAAIEEAYRRLIKRYHPDRSGGDAERAAEINRAYFELRQQHERAQSDPQPARPVHPAPVRRSSRAPARQRKRRRRRGIWPVLVVALAAVLLLQRERLAEQGSTILNGLADARAPVLAAGQGSAAQVDSALVDGALNEAVIEQSIAQAVSIAERGQEQELAQQSRACHARLRSSPDLAQLDRCAAFDDAAAILVDRESLHESGAFSPSAVTARQMTAASLLSSDFLAIERRLDRIRTMAELSIRPRPPPLTLPPLAPEQESEALLLQGDPEAANGF